MEALQTLASEAMTLRIATVRGQRVIVDADLAALYGVETKRFNEAVKRDLAKFPDDFRFTLSSEEFQALRSQFATSNDQSPGRGGRRYAPRVFTEHGALMAATILNSPRAVEISIFVVRAFVRQRELASTHGELARRLDELEQKTEALAMKLPDAACCHPGEQRNLGHRPEPQHQRHLPLQPARRLRWPARRQRARWRASANGSQPLSSFGLYEIGSNGAVVASWAGTPGLGVRGVAELGNGRYLVNEAGGGSATRGLGTIDPAGALNNNNFTLIQGNVNGGWISAAVLPVPEPASGWLLLGGVATLAAQRRQANARRIAPMTAA